VQKYQNAIQDVKGNAVAGATVAVYIYGTTTPATIYSDNGVTPIVGNSVTTDSSGEFFFYAANGRYSLTVTAINFTTDAYRDISLFDSADYTAPIGAGLPSQTGNSGKVLSTNGTTPSWTAPGFATGLPNWNPLTPYAVDAKVLAPEGRPIVCNTAHTSPAVYNCLNWTYPSDDNSTIVDFTLLPNGNASTTVPTNGRVVYFGMAEADWGDYGVVNGRFTESSPGSGPIVTYYQTQLPDSIDKVQHIWCEFEVASSPSPGAGLTLLVGNYLFPVAPAQAAIHWGFIPNIAGTPSVYWQSGPYNIPGSGDGPLFDGSSGGLAGSPYGKTFRLDVTMDVTTGHACGFINGQMALEYTDLNLIGYMTSYGGFEINGANFKIKRFGISAALPNFATDGSRRNVWKRMDDVLPGIAPITITTTWKSAFTFVISYDAMGMVVVDWAPFITNTSSGVVVRAVLGTNAETQASLNSAFYHTKLCIGPFNGRVPFQVVRRGTPYTSEQVTLYIATESGTATLQDQTYGDKVGGPSWRPATGAATTKSWVTTSAPAAILNPVP
jgi:hypothetical protein